MPTARVHHADGLWLADVARPSGVRTRGALKSRHRLFDRDKKKNHLDPEVPRTPSSTLGTLGFYFAVTEVPRLEGPPATLWRGKPPTDPPEARPRAGATLYLP